MFSELLWYGSVGDNWAFEWERPIFCCCLFVCYLIGFGECFSQLLWCGSVGDNWALAWRSEEGHSAVAFTTCWPFCSSALRCLRRLSSTTINRLSRSGHIFYWLLETSGSLKPIKTSITTTIPFFDLFLVTQFWPAAAEGWRGWTFETFHGTASLFLLFVDSLSKKPSLNQGSVTFLRICQTQRNKLASGERLDLVTFPDPLSS